MDPGDPVLVRSIYRRNVGMWHERYGLYCQPGNQGKLVKQSLGAEADGYLKIWMSDAPPFDWTWERTLALGIFNRESAAEVRTRRERVIAARPWPTGWEAWRPPNHWTPLPLPCSWEVVS